MHIDLAGLIHAPATATVDGATLSLVIVGACYVDSDEPRPDVQEVLADVLATPPTPTPAANVADVFIRLNIALDETRELIPEPWRAALTAIASEDQLPDVEIAARAYLWLDNAGPHIRPEARDRIAAALAPPAPRDELADARARRELPDTTARMLAALPRLVDATRAPRPVPCALCLVRYGERAGTILAVPLAQLAVEVQVSGLAAR